MTLTKRHWIRLHHFVFLLSLFSLLPDIQAQSEKGTPFIHNIPYTEYKQHPQNFAVVQDKRGVMYFGNAFGILEYDGSAWRFIPLKDHSTPLSLAIDSLGTIYAGGIYEFGYLSPTTDGDLAYISLSQHLDGGYNHGVHFVHTSHEGVYFCAEESIVRWNGHHKKMDVWLPNEGNSFWASSFNDELYIYESNRGLLKMKNDSLELVRGGEYFSNINMDVQFLLPYEKNKLLVSTFKKGLFIYDTLRYSVQKLTTEADSSFLSSYLFYAMRLSDGNYAFALDGKGLIIMDKYGKILERLNSKNGLQNDNINPMYRDTQGGIWLSLNKGISRVEFDAPFRHWEFDGSINRVIRNKGVIYIGSDYGTYFMKENRMTPIQDLNTECWDLLNFTVPDDTTQQLLLAATQNGVYEVSENNAELILPFSVRTLYVPPQQPDRVFISALSYCATMRYEDKKWIYEGEIEGISGDIYSFFSDEDGTIWLGSIDESLFRIDMQGPDSDSMVVTKYDTISTQVRAFNGSVIFTMDEGVYKYDKIQDTFILDSVLIKFNQNDNYINNFREDEKGDIWVWVYNPVKPKVWIEHGIKTGENTYVFDTIAFKRLPEMVIWALYPEKNGATWFGGTEGLYKYDTKVKKDYQHSFHTLIRSVIIDEDSVIFNGTNFIKNDTNRLVSLIQPEELKPVLPYTNNSLIFNYALPDFDNEAANQFSYYLEGYDKNWSAWSTETKKEYTNLPEGKYTFCVKAKNIYDMESSIAAYHFTLLPPWYRTFLAYAIYVVIAMFLFFLAIKAYTKRLKAQNIRLMKEKQMQQDFSRQLITSQEGERKRIAAELHDGVGQSLILIKNKILMFSDPKNENTESHLGGITEQITDTIQEVRSISYGLRPFKIDMLGLTKSIKDMIRGVEESVSIRIKVTIDNIDRVFPKDLEINVYRIVQECINNIVKHAQATEADITIQKEESKVVCHISDNGRGLASHTNSHQAARNGFGLMGIEERLSLLGGKLTIQSTSGQGLTLHIVIPFETHAS